MGARGKLRQPIQWPKVPLALAYVISGRVSAAPAPADAPLLPGSVSFALPRPPYDVSGPLADGCLEIRGEAQGSAKVLLRNGKVVFFSSSWLPDEPRWEELLGRLQPVAWYEHRALEAGGALWPDFPQGAATVRRSAAMAHDHGVLPTVKVELESRPHPRLRLQAQITLCAWTGQVREVRRQPDTVYACPLVPRVGEADAVAAAREAVQQQGSTAGAYEWVQTELGQRGGSLCWVVLLGRLRSAHVPGYARFIRGVSVDADTGRVLATEREVDFDGIFQSVGGWDRTAPGPPARLPGERDRSACDARPSVAPDGIVVYVSNRPRHLFPWWYGDRQSVVLRGLETWCWYSASFLTSYSRAVQRGQTLFALTGDRLEIVDVAEGTMRTVAGVRDFAVDGHGGAFCVLVPSTRTRPARLQVYSAGAPEQPVQALPNPASGDRIVSMDMSPSGSQVAYTVSPQRGARESRTYLWDMGGGRSARLLTVHDEGWPLSYSPDGRSLCLGVGRPQMPHLLSVTDGAVTRVEIPGDVSGREPLDWAYGADASELVFSGLDGTPGSSMTGRSVFRWNMRARRLGRLAPDQAADPEPLRFGVGTTALSLTCGALHEWWQDLVREQHQRATIADGQPAAEGGRWVAPVDPQPGPER